MAKESLTNAAAAKKKAPAKTPAAQAVEAAVKAATPAPAASSRPAGGTSEVKITLSHDQIAKRAYMIWLAKGKPAGRDAENWLQAVSELRSGR
ncbi:MAG: DUF2934 domain-containing protein [Phycisphaeraceae bacterium]|nr:DUF2934 domain-containing protein [Phycisphaeraceae bacterium]